MNIFTIHGRLARDPEYIRGQEAKNDRTKFAVAVDRRYGDETDFFDCVVFGGRAAVIDKYFKKGSEILISGEMQTRTYEDRNGVKRKAYTLVVSTFDFCGSKNDGSGSNPAPTNQAPAPSEPAPDEPIPEGFEQIEEDIPF